MNIHEHQAKELLKKYGANVPNGVFALTVKPNTPSGTTTPNCFKICLA